MKTLLLVLVILALSAPSVSSAQERASNDLNTLLRDAFYVFNRFEEMSVGVQVQIETSYPVQVRNNSKNALSGALRNVATEKVALNAMIEHGKVSSPDLLDVYTELVEVASELNAVAYEMTDWGDPKSSVDLAQLGAKATTLSALVSVTLKSRIAAQELQLASCMQKTAPKH